MTDADLDAFESYRPLLFSIAYRMIGSVMEAEDVVQETYLRYQTASSETIRSMRAFLTTITTRLSLDHLKSARVQRESYVGQWLPEPLMTEESPFEIVRQREMVSMAFLVLLESLTPVQRAVYLLREVFDYPYAEISSIVGKSEAACRQHFRSAKQHLVERRPRFDVEQDAHNRLVYSFLDAISSGDVEALTGLLAEDATLWSDGGGKVAAARHPLHGRDIIIRLLVGAQKMRPDGLRTSVQELNGEPSLVFRVHGQVMGVMSIATDGEHIHEIRAVWNPDKLQHL
jgi:RNA polymerase sigma-70 factor (ECF subfamily)